MLYGDLIRAFPDPGSGTELRRPPNNRENRNGDWTRVHPPLSYHPHLSTVVLGLEIRFRVVFVTTG